MSEGVIAKGCPGSAEYGHGFSLTRVHAGGCCDRWAERAISDDLSRHPDSTDAETIGPD